MPKSKKSYSKRKTEDYIFKRKLKFFYSRIVKIFYFILFLGFIAICVWAFRFEGSKKISEFTYDKANSFFISLGLRIKSIEIKGNKVVPTDIILKNIFSSLGNVSDKSIMLLDLQKLSDDIKSIGWIENVDIRKKLPDTVIVTIYERMPQFIWQNSGRLWLADTDGDLLTEQIEKKYIFLPVIVGQDSKKDIPEFLNILSAAPKMSNLVIGASKIGNRRWDISLKNNIKVKLPEENAGDAWKKLSELNDKNSLFTKKINYVDLRVENQLITGLDENEKDEIFENRKALEQQEKQKN